MSTVTFNCTQCGKLMGVSSDYLGKPVRCPHCQQVIQAPASNPAAPGPPPEQPPAVGRIANPSYPEQPPAPDAQEPSAPVFNVPSSVHSDSIFEGSDENAGDALFGSAKPLVEMPPEPPVPNVQIEASPSPEASLPTLQIEAALPHGTAQVEQPPATPTGPGCETTVTYVAPESGIRPGSGLNFAAAPAADKPSGTSLNFTAAQAGDRPSPSGSALHDAVGLEAGHEQANEPLTTIGRSGVHRPARGGLLVPTLLIFLIPYAVVATVAIIFLYMKKQEPSLEILPDPKPDKKSGGPSRRGSGQRVRINLKVPPQLRGPVGQTIGVGDLVVTPQKIEQLPGHRLRLTLSMKNRSEDVEFNPVSSDFLKIDSYTYLEFLGKKERIWGGEWLLLRRGGWFEGRLGPGEEMVAQLTTGPEDARKVRTLQQQPLALLWRIQVRRGFVQVRGKDISATAVIGVEFHSTDVLPSKAKDDV
jgi:hypothetical protein